MAAFLEQPAGQALMRAVFAEAVAPSIAALAKRQIEQSAGGPARAMLLRAGARGEWRDDADPTVVLSMLVGALLHRVALERQRPTRAWLGSVVAVLLRGVT